jgi:DNA-binding transcriptional MerR regulator
MSETKKWYKISALERLSGVSRRTIHFYLHSGLLHPPMKTGKTMSYYDDEHLRRLEIIQRLKKQRVPLFQIKEQIQDGKADDCLINGAASASTPLPEKVRKEQAHHHLKSRGRRTRDKIIGQGCAFFCRKGYRDTSVSDITQALKVGKGTFYFYFKDKKALFLECMPLIFEALFLDGWQRIRKEQDPVRRLELRAMTVFPVLPQFCAIIHLCKEAMEDDDDRVRQMGRNTFLSIRKPLETDIKKGADAGFFRNINPKIAGSMMIAMIENMYYLKSLDPDMDHGLMWEAVSGILISGITK